MAGALFEGLVVGEAMKVFTVLGQRPELYFWRSHDGLEVDLLVRVGATFVPVEIKLTATPTVAHTEPLARITRLAGKRIGGPGVVVCRVREQRPLPSGHIAMPWQEFPAWLEARLRRGDGKT
jgi:predicted AAA+ superfamily ATPase